MPQKNAIVVLGAVLMGALLLGAGVAVAGVTDDGNAAQPEPEQQTDDRSITVSATGEVDAEPDQAVIRVSVEARDDDPEAARSKVAENATSMREALRELGLDDDQVRTTDFDIHEYRERPREEGGESEVTYQARHQFEVELDDVDRVGEVIDAAVGGGATGVDGVQFTLADDTRDELRREALRQATDSAREQADTIAERGNLSVTGMHSATTEDVRIPYQRVEYAAMADSGDAAGTSIDPGPVTVSATVSVQYDVSD